MEGQVAGSDGHYGVGKGVKVDQTAVMHVNEKLEVSQKISTEDRKSHICNHEIPGVGFAGRGNIHGTNTVGLDRRTVGGPQSDV